MLLTTTSKVTAVKKLIREKKYEEAIEIAEKINPEKVASVYDLSVIAEAYIRTGRLEDARDLYLVMYDRNKSHKVMTGLIELHLKLRQPEQASAYLREFRKMEPDNPERLIYRYRVDTMLGKSPEYLVKSLAKLKTEEYTDVWALELAKAYYKNNDREACAAECHSILKYFPDSEVAGKAKVLLGACEVADDDAEVVENDVKIADEDDAVEVAESLEKDVSQMLEEAAAAEAVANEVIDDKTMSSVTPMQPVPYLRTLEFMIQSKPAGEDRSTYTEEPASKEDTPAEEIVEAAVSEKEEYVLPEALRGQIDNIIYDDDDDDDDDEDEMVFTGYFTEDGRVASEVENETAEEVETADAEAEETESEDEVDESETDEESDEDEDVEDDEEDVEESEEVEDDTEESEEETDDEDEESEEDSEDTDETDDASDDEDSDEEEAEEADDEEDSDEDDDDEFEDDEADDDSEDEDDEPEDDEESDEEDAYDDGFDDEYDEYQGDDGLEEDEEDDLANTSEKLSQSEDPYVDEALDSVADKLASQILSATAEEQSLRESDAEDAAEDAAKALADTRVMEASPGKSLGSVLQDDDKAIEKALYSLLEEAKSAKKD